jgi:hypothetical protein
MHTYGLELAQLGNMPLGPNLLGHMGDLGVIPIN